MWWVEKGQMTFRQLFVWKFVCLYFSTLGKYKVYVYCIGTRQIIVGMYKLYIYSRCGRVVRDFEREAKTRCIFQFRWARRHWFYEIFKNDNVQGLRSKFIKVVVDPLFFGQKNYWVLGIIYFLFSCYKCTNIWKFWMGKF